MTLEQAALFMTSALSVGLLISTTILAKRLGQLRDTVDSARDELVELWENNRKLKLAMALLNTKVKP